MEKARAKAKIENVCGGVKVVELVDGTWGVTDMDDNVIVPFGRYAWIDRFDQGYARVKSYSGKQWIPVGLPGEGIDPVVTETPKWGIIDTKGEVVLPVEYDSVWNFVGKDRDYTTIEKDGGKDRFYIRERAAEADCDDDGDRGYPYDEPGWGSYEEYGGYNGYDDFTIDSAFDGDPEATWNID